MKPVDPTRIAQRMSLRAPLAESLTLLAKLATTTNVNKDTDIAQTHVSVATECPTFRNFEDGRPFPSLTFDIATGVGKTRLMGAFIAWLYLSGRSANFFVLAPNGTIYRKLVEDFTPGTKKYVFTGISEFATLPPVIVTGEDYQSGHGARRGQLKLGAGVYDDAATINIFNIQKINQTAEGSRELRIRKLSECIGQSYFEYLQDLPDLVLVMDESHRYRAKAGFATLNDLRPILGLELTATPFVQNGATKVPFNNVVYSFPLRKAMEAGYVKEPACTVRPDLKLDELTVEQLDLMKLKDGMRIHEETKTNLLLYAKENGRTAVKPFVLVVARDTTHADGLKTLMESAEFFEGSYKGKVIVVTSTQSGEEKEENIERLQKIEEANEPTEVVIHVHMLKEGWDVRNLYTLIPLNAAHSAQMIEQSIGRGLRLPYGERTGDPRADNLTVVAHDRYNEIIANSKQPGSMFQVKELVLPPGGPPVAPKPVEAPSTIEHLLGIAIATVTSGGATTELPLPTPARTRALVVPTSMTAAQGQAVAAAVFKVIQQSAKPGAGPFGGSKAFTTPAGKAQVAQAVTAQLGSAGLGLVAAHAAGVAAIVEQVAALAAEMTIEVPRVSVSPVGEVRFVIDPFVLDCSAMSWQAVENKLIVEQIRTGEQYEVNPELDLAPEQDIRDYIVRSITDADDLPYDDHADLLYDLAGQAIAHLTVRLRADDAVRNVVLGHQMQLGALIREQALAHGREIAGAYETKVASSCIGLTHVHVALPDGESPRTIWKAVSPLSATKGAVFSGMAKSIATVAKFDSDGERRMATVLEHDKAVLRWVKPSPGAFMIHLKGGANYNPDFVAMTTTAKYIAEIKADSEINDPGVQEKARAAAAWCAMASLHDPSGLPWRYAIIPDHVPEVNYTLEGLWKQYQWRDSAKAP